MNWIKKAFDSVRGKHGAGVDVGGMHNPGGGGGDYHNGQNMTGVASLFRSIYSRKGTTARETFERLRGWVYICSNKNATAVSAVPLRLYAARRAVDPAINPARAPRNLGRLEQKRLGRIPSFANAPAFKAAMSTLTNVGELVEVGNHPFIDLLNDPNPLTTGVALFEKTSMSLDLCGESYWFHPTDARGWPIQICALPPTRVCPLFDPSDVNMVTAFRFLNWSGKLVTIPADQMTWFKTANPIDPFCGLGWAQATSDAIDRFFSYDEFEAALTANNARPDMVVKYTEGSLTPTERNDLERDIRNRLRGNAQSGSAIVMDQAFEIEQLGWSPRDMANLMGREWSLMEIAAGAGIPFGLLNNKDFNKANMEASLTLWARGGIEPRLRRLEPALCQLLKKYEPNGRLVAIFDSSVPEDREFELKQEVAYLAGQVVTPNEIRAKRRLGDPLEGGDEVVAASRAENDSRRGDRRRDQAEADDEEKNFPAVMVKEYVGAVMGGEMSKAAAIAILEQTNPDHAEAIKGVFDGVEEPPPVPVVTWPPGNADA